MSITDFVADHISLSSSLALIFKNGMCLTHLYYIDAYLMIEAGGHPLSISSLQKFTHKGLSLTECVAGHNSGLPQPPVKS